jgi:hypothetical protein
MPQPFYLRKRHGAHCTGGWVGLRGGLLQEKEGEVKVYRTEKDSEGYRYNLISKVFPSIV